MRKAFTLSEVLITLTIIGIVAAMTLPTLIGKYKEKQTVTAVKVAYSTFSQAFMQIVNDYGSLYALAPSTTSGENNSGYKKNANYTITAMQKYIKTIRTCDKKTNCMASDYKTLDGSKSYNWDTFSNLQTGILANGMSFWILNGCGVEGYVSSDKGSCAQLGFDINGTKKPNIMGEDFFWFSIRDNGKFEIFDSTSKCDKHGTKDYNGYYCASYIILNENMDYLHK